MPATTIQLCLYDVMHRCKIPQTYSQVLTLVSLVENKITNKIKLIITM